MDAGMNVDALIIISFSKRRKLNFHPIVAYFFTSDRRYGLA